MDGGPGGPIRPERPPIPYGRGVTGPARPTPVAPPFAVPAGPSGGSPTPGGSLPAGPGAPGPRPRGGPSGPGGATVPSDHSGPAGQGEAGVTDASPLDVDRWDDGSGVTTSVVLVVQAPGGSTVGMLARWVDAGTGRRPVLVLSDVPGSSFWWGVPAAVLLVVGHALQVFRAHRQGTADVVVLGDRRAPVPTLTELPVHVVDGVPSVLSGRAPRVLDTAEAVAAARSLRLRPVPDLLGRMRLEHGSRR